MIMLISRSGRQNQRYENGRRLIAGCIPYRFKADQSNHDKCVQSLEVLVVKSQKSDRVLFPKGGWEKDETVEDAARREAMEEAGVEGLVETQLGIWTFNSKGSKGGERVAHVFPLKVTNLQDHWPEKEFRERRWVSVEDARKRCKHPWMSKALDQLIMRERERHGMAFN
ncbi:nudix hydrolase 17, mitochondrial-like [Nymphaea colorata]|nr:nudix hydrolase 17, mitochondrial-like [Nymphaea colorata]